MWEKVALGSRFKSAKRSIKKASPQSTTYISVFWTEAFQTKQIELFDFPARISGLPHQVSTWACSSAPSFPLPDRSVDSCSLRSQGRGGSTRGTFGRGTRPRTSNPVQDHLASLLILLILLTCLGQEKILYDPNSFRFAYRIGAWRP